MTAKASSLSSLLYLPCSCLSKGWQALPSPIKERINGFVSALWDSLNSLMCGSLLCFVQLISSLSAGQIKFFRNCENDRKGDPDFGSGVLPHLLCAILRLKDPTITVPKKITEGLTHKLFLDQLEAKVKDLRQSTSLIAKEGATRLIYAVYTLAAFVLRGCELMVGLISLLGVASTIGSSSRVNDFTMSHLSGAGMLEDILYGLGKIINPKNYLAEGSNRDENDFLLI